MGAGRNMRSGKVEGISSPAPFAPFLIEKVYVFFHMNKWFKQNSKDIVSS